MPQSGPRLLVVTEGRAGDDRQLRALAEALGWPVAELAFRCPLGRVLRDRVAEALGVTGPPPAALAAVLADPPDLVLASGGRAVGALRRLRRAGGARPRIVVLGRPWARLDALDLVVTTPQYGLPAGATVLCNRLPLNTVPRARLAEARAHWAPRVAALPAPYVTVLLGGDSGTYRLDAGTARRLAERASARAAALGGSVLATSSPRTPPAALNAFAAGLAGPHWLHRWKPDDPDNPVTGFLALASRLIVTGESASMLAEACRTGQPVEVVRLARRPRARLLAPLARGLARLGLGVPPRDMTPLLDGLWDHAGRVDAQGPHIHLSAMRDDDLDRTLRRIRALVAGTE